MILYEGYKKGVYYLTPEKAIFSDLYIAVRNKEGRVLSNKQVALLPNIKNKEWKLREKSSKRFLYYLSNKKDVSILDIGCGNGWFSNSMAKVSKHNTVIGLDVNSEELEQGTYVFSEENLQFVYGDIFKITTFEKQFDIITLNGCIQYFSDLKKLITKLSSFLKPNGEIHIIDSPFYDMKDVKFAKERTLLYYSKLGFPDMAKHYFHHSKDNLFHYNIEILYNPKRNLISKILNKNDSPFMWVKLKK